MKDYISTQWQRKSQLITDSGISNLPQKEYKDRFPIVIIENNFKWILLLKQKKIGVIWITENWGFAWQEMKQMQFKIFLCEGHHKEKVLMRPAETFVL